MFIGASPGSTGGGVKTTSAALLVMLMWNRLKGNLDVNIFNRTIPREIVSRTISIIFASAFSVAIITSVLLIAGGGKLPPLESRHYFVEYLFDTVSAFGTVGLVHGSDSKAERYPKICSYFDDVCRKGRALDTRLFSFPKQWGKRLNLCRRRSHGRIIRLRSVDCGMRNKNRELRTE